MALQTSEKRIGEMIGSEQIKPINTSKGKLRPRWAIPQEQIDALAKPKQVAPVVKVKKHI